MKCSNTLIQEILALSRHMLTLSNEGTAAANDDGCRLLFGILGDCAYKLRLEAQREKERHQAKGKWEEPTICGTGDRTSPANFSCEEVRSDDEFEPVKK